MHFSLGGKWLGSVTIVTLFLAGSLPANSVQASFYHPERQSSTVLVSLSTDSSIVGRQLNLASSRISDLKIKTETKINRLKVEEKRNQKVIVSNSKKIASFRNKPIQLAETSFKVNQQLSRGHSDELIKNALSLLGTPYVFGGETRSGFDCSGFTQYVYKGSGLSIPRTSYQQFKVGYLVSRQQLKPGDLVFFTTYTKGASHVGIYIGDGKFVHASDGGVRITSLNENYYKTRYLGARRIK